jgi:hypothetical protein
MESMPKLADRAQEPTSAMGRGALSPLYAKELQRLPNSRLLASLLKDNPRVTYMRVLA